MNHWKDWRQEEKGTTEDEMVKWHHRLDGHEFEQAPEVGNGQGSLLCCSPYGGKESDTTERLNLCSNKTAAFYWLGESPYSWPSKGLSLEARVFPGGSDSKESA